MKILAIDTAHGICSVALAESGVVIAQKNEYEQSRQAERLFTIIAEILQENNLSFSDINLVAANIGPGSFTGIRIGLAAARGIAMAAKIPIIGVTGFEALEHALRPDATCDNILIAFDARRGQVFTKFYLRGEGGEELLIDNKNVPALVMESGRFEIAGDGASIIEPFMLESNLNYSITEKLKLPAADMVAKVAFEKISSGCQSINNAPLYIRLPDAKLPKISDHKLIGGLKCNLS